MQKLLTAAIVSLLVSSPAVAQDWDRWFVGFDAGYIWRSVTTGAEGRMEYEGAAVGVSFGKWWLYDQVAFGAEAVVGLGGTGYQSADPPYFYGQVQDVVTLGVRGKVGVPLGRFMPYVAAGPQYIHSAQRTEMSGDVVHSGHVKLGAVLAAGAEMMVSDNLAIKAEGGLNLKFDDNSLVTNFSGWSGKIGINYYFD